MHLRFTALLVVLSIVAVPSVAALHELYFIGPGGEEVEDPSTLVSGENPSRYAVQTSLEGSAETSFRQVGLWNVDADELGVIPTFVYEGDPGSIVFDGTTPIVVHIWEEKADAGCGNLGQLFDQDGNILGPEGGAETDQAPGAPGSPSEVTFTFEGIAGTFSGLKVQVSQAFSNCGNGAVWWWGSDTYPARIVTGLPNEDAGGGNGTAQTHDVNLTNPEASITHQFNGTSDDYIHHWDNPHAALNLSYEVEVANGSLELTIQDADGEVVHTDVLDQDGDVMEIFEDAAEGSWEIRIDYRNFTGRFSLLLEERVEAEDNGTSSATGTSTPTDTATDTQSSTDTSTGNETMGGGEDSPAMPVLVALIVLVGSAAAVRRRW